MVDKKTVLKVAHLARLHVSDGQAQEYQEQFIKILDHFKKIQELDCDAVSPMRSPILEKENLRADFVRQTLTVEELLQNAPESKGHLFKVPPVV